MNMPKHLRTGLGLFQNVGMLRSLKFGEKYQQRKHIKCESVAIAAQLFNIYEGCTNQTEINK
jgi:hypothetical protein